MTRSRRPMTSVERRAAQAIRPGAVTHALTGSDRQVAARLADKAASAFPLITPAQERSLWRLVWLHRAVITDRGVLEEARRHAPEDVPC